LASLAAQGFPIRGWSFGGGTALMLQLHHRHSKDIDFFVPDPQYLGLLSPRLSGHAVWGGPDYDETSHYIKLRYADGEIDFIAAPPISTLPCGDYLFEGHVLAIESPVEIVLKKLFYRADLLKPRDIFDTAVVLASSHASQLLNNLPLIVEKRSALLKRLGNIPDEYFKAAMEELDVLDDWKHVIPGARRTVIELIDASPLSDRALPSPAPR
jgi:hypothetical protein